MARLFRQRYTKTTPDGRKVTQQSRKWYVEYRDGQGIRRRVPGYGDKQATQQLASELERQAAREQSGLVDRHEPHRKRALVEHLEDWKATLGKNTAKEVAQKVTRVRRVCDEAGFCFWPDIDQVGVWRFIGKLRKARIKKRTQAHYLQAVHQFTRWLVTDGRMPTDPLFGMKAETVDDEEEAGIFEPQELGTLLEVTECGPVRRRMAGAERALLYRLAAETGFRSKECRTLTWDCVDLGGEPPTATVTAKRAKNHKAYQQPLTPNLVRMLREQHVRTGLTGLVFPRTPDETRVATMLRADMEAAGLPLNDAADRVRGFHSLRHSFATNLANAGVKPHVAMALLRHSDINLTMKRYTHTLLPTQASAIAALPDLSPDKLDRQRQRVTGTDGKSLPPGLPTFLPTCLPARAASQTSSVASHCTMAANDSGVSYQANSVEQVVSCTSLHPVASGCADDMAQPPEGLEPTTCGLQNRCSTN